MREAKDFGPDERWNHGKEDLLLEGRHTKHARCLAPDALHWYWRRRLLAPRDPKENARLFSAGLRFGDDFRRSGIDPQIISAYSEWIASFDSLGLAGRRLAAYQAWRKACVAVDWATDILIEVCCFGRPIGKPNMEVLRRGLGTLAKHYGH